MEELKQYVRTIPDFPKKGIMFRDITTLVQDPKGFKLSIQAFEKVIGDTEYDAIVANDARGFIFGAPIAYNNDKGMVLVRKKGKLPFKTVETSYFLEYGSATVEMNVDALKPGDKVILIDDLIATGGTFKAAAELVEKLGAEVVMIVALIELPELHGRELLKDYDVRTVIAFEGE